ncbi:hypothetical protein COLO4_15163 [Corchorus olitorius]|uniref:Uncharacterized protein n=1 Tax=Corchorus olitorius TaxID=93759 RepID=A0A1R3JPM7_9ROSI|nr:hypothetical protein COLO4_15163 [Corchorus olitorius]
MTSRRRSREEAAAPTEPVRSPDPRFTTYFTRSPVFPCLSSEVLRHHHMVDFDNVTPVQVKSTIDDQKMKAFGFTTLRSGLWENEHRALFLESPKVKASTPPRLPPSDEAGPSSSTPLPSDLASRLENIEATQADLLAVQAEMRGYFLQILQYLGLQPPPP